LAEASAPVDPVAGLIDIPLPPEVSLWPQTLTARATIVVMLLALAVSAWTFARRRYHDRYRREALAEVERIARSPGGVEGELALLVRRTALAAFPREQVAALEGPAWLAFLDRSYGGVEFSRGAGRALATTAYAPHAAAEPSQLIDLVRRWIEGHHA
jgi:Ca-activated chloride channel family protein